MAKDRSQNLSELLSAYLDGELDEATTAKVVAHLERDANAGLLLRELRETRSMLQDLQRGSAPADFAESVVAAVERRALLGEVDEESLAGSGRRRFGPLRSAAAILFLVGAAGSWIYWQIDRVQLAEMSADRSSTDAGSLADGHRPPDDFADSLAAAEGIADEAASTSGRAGMDDDSSEPELVFDQLSAASSSGVEEIAIKARGVTDSLPATVRRSGRNTGGRAASGTPLKKAESIEEFDVDGEDENQVVMLGTEWSADGAGDAEFVPAEFGLLRRLRVVPASSPIVANFIQQLEQGQSSETLAAFQFDGESNSLVLDFDNYPQRERFTRGVEALLVSNRFLNVADPVARSQVADPEIQNVYLSGNTGINYTESNTTQILLRAPMEVLEALLDEYADSTKYPIMAESVELKMGDIRVAGVDDARRTMKAMAVPQLREKMLLEDHPRAELSRGSTETPTVGRTVDEWKLYYDQIGENGEALFGEQVAQAGQSFGPDLEQESEAEASVQLQAASRGPIVGGAAAETSVQVEGTQADAPARSSEFEDDLKAGDAEGDEVAKKKRRARPTSRSIVPLVGPVDVNDKPLTSLDQTSEPILNTGRGFFAVDKESGRQAGKGVATGTSRRAGNLTFILKMRVPAPAYEFEGPPAPPSLKSKASTLAEPQSKG